MPHCCRKAVPQAEITRPWVGEQRRRGRERKELTHERMDHWPELMERGGAKVIKALCPPCHQTRMAAACHRRFRRLPWPVLLPSATMTGHIDIVVNGKARTACRPLAEQPQRSRYCGDHHHERKRLGKQRGRHGDAQGNF